jgi:hypothetical protein
MAESRRTRLRTSNEKPEASDDKLIVSAVTLPAYPILRQHDSR